MKKLLLGFTILLSVSQIHANILEKLPLTPKQMIIGAAVVTAGTLGLRYLFHNKYEEEIAKLSGHQEDNHIDENGAITNSNSCLLNQEIWCNSCNKMTDLKSQTIASYLGIQSQYTLIYSPTENKTTSLARPMMGFPLLRYCLYPIAYFSETRQINNS